MTQTPLDLPLEDLMWELENQIEKYVPRSYHTCTRDQFQTHY